MARSHWLPASGLSLAMAANVGVADAGPSEARELFEQGRQAVADGDQERACALFEQSIAEHERAGTHFNLARCSIRTGALLQARDHYDRGLALIAADAPGRDIIVRDRAALVATIPRLAIRLAEESPPGVVVRLDGVHLSPEKLDTDVAVDPGRRVVSVDVPGGGKEQVTIALGEGERRQVTVGGKRMVVLPASSTEPGDDTSTSMLVGGWTLIGLGIAGVAAGVVTGALAAERHGRVEDLCPDTRCTTQEGFDAAQQGKTLVIVNAVALGLGLASAAVGTTLVILAGDDDQPNGAKITLRFAF